MNRLIYLFTSQRQSENKARDCNKWFILVTLSVKLAIKLSGWLSKPTANIIAAAQTWLGRLH